MGYGKEYLRKKHHHTLCQVFASPVSTAIKWQDIEMLIIALGGEVSMGRGSRVRFLLNDSVAHFHRPYPDPTTDKGAVLGLRHWLQEQGVMP
ncbi:hexulose-6-phosphate synthase [Franconibacter pulveris]|uniref:Hexulose-6-phosphate synthase n=1 Tax=Franconibacter pulveris TaxID=435910 RepID=A0A0J8VS32_9ENTR|nr:hexulose-6-phosphate synthase [Franconibacter pulveris]KMV35747.1 hexulose-6-phosphate synthase [Franconibacter pulveris]